MSRDPRHDTTPEAVLDLDQVRKALGYNQINIYGVSYGVTTGLAYLQRYGSHVRAAVLDSGSLLPVPEEQLDASHAQHAFDQLAARCAATPGCARSYHPAADLATVLARLTAHPAQVTLPGPGGQRRTLTVTAAMVTGMVDVQLTSIQTAVLLPAALHALALVRRRPPGRVLRGTIRPAGGPSPCQGLALPETRPDTAVTAESAWLSSLGCGLTGLGGQRPRRDDEQAAGQAAAR